MKKIHRDALAKLGITSEAYADVPHYEGDVYVEEGLWPPRWGITLEGPGRNSAVVDHTAKDFGDDADGLYHLRPKRGSKKSISAHRTQREAIAAYIERLYS